MAYDIIGDIHGHAAKLTDLLSHLGYRERNGAWRHPDPQRTALFVGDFIDRGPGQLETLRIVRAMREAGAAEAVMGNHEFNALAWAMPDPKSPGKHLRRHNEKNQRQHQAFLTSLGGNDTTHREWIDWMFTLPLWLDLPKLRVIHACWHAPSIAALEPLLKPGQTLDAGLVEAASRENSPAFTAVEALVKGLDVHLPPGFSFTDGEGNVRRKVRVRWWDEAATTFRSGAIVDAATQEQLPDVRMPDSALCTLDHAKPVIFGHYWMAGQPRVLAPTMACVDYSATRDGHPLVAYRWDGEVELRDDNFVAADPFQAKRAKVRP